MKTRRGCARQASYVIASRAPRSPETIRFNLRAGTVGLACLLVVLLFCLRAAAQSGGGLPTSIGWSSLPANTSLAASGACPSNGFGGDPFPFAEYCSNVIRAWSGAVADTVGDRLIIWGGGSTSYYGNEIYSLNLTANPVTLTRVKDPTVPTNYANSAECIDGIPPGNSTFSPNSRDTFGGLAFIPSSDTLFATGGALACVFGARTNNTWTISLKNLSNSTLWQDQGPRLSGPLPGSNGGEGYGNVAAYDPNTGLVFVSDGAALYTYNSLTNSYAQITPTYGFTTNIYLSGAIDPTRKLFVLVGGCNGGTCTSGSGVYVADISNPASTTQQDWTAATLADANCAEFLNGGVNPIGSASPGFTFDSVANDFVGWPNQGNSVYIMTPDPVNKRLTCQKQTFAGGPPNSATGNGTFGRFQYFPGIDVFVLVNDWNIPAYVLRLQRTQSGPAVSLSPSSLTFSDQLLSTTSAPQTITLTNTGSSSLNVSSVTPAGDYAESNNCIVRSPLAPSANCTISVTFTPLGVGTLSGALTIQDNAGSGTQTVGLTGVGVTLTSISVTPSNATVVLGTPQQFTATGTFSDGSSQELTNAAWSSSNTNVATVSLAGLVSGVTTGSITLSAQSGSVTGSVIVSVASTGLPTAMGWTALPASTSLQGSGACPPDFFGGDSFMFNYYCPNIIRAWSGAIADTVANRLIIWGGGHNNYYGNEIYALNLTENPVTLTRLNDPTVPTNANDRTNCIEAIPPGVGSAPNSRESYGGMAFIQDYDIFFVTSGSLACLGGGGSHGTWTISLANVSDSTPWRNADIGLTGPGPGSEGGGTYGNVAEYDPNSGLVFVADAGAIYTYNYQANTYNRITPPSGFTTNIYLSGAIDPTRKLFVLVGGCNGGTCTPGSGVFVADISNPTSTTQQDWTAATLADANCAEFLSGGVNPIGTGNPGITFDSVANDFVAWPNQGNSVYIMTPDPVNQRLTCQKQTFANGPPNSAQGEGPNTTWGTYGRFRYFPALDAFVLVNDWDIPAYILRLR